MYTEPLRSLGGWWTFDAGSTGVDMARGGTSLYLAPEASGICVRKGPWVALDPTIDIFSLGIVPLQVLGRSSEPVTGVNMSRLDGQEWDAAYSKTEICVTSLSRIRLRD